MRLCTLRVIESLLSSNCEKDENISKALSAVKRCLQVECTKQTPSDLREFLHLILHMHCGRGGIVGSLLAAEVVALFFPPV